MASWDSDLVELACELVGAWTAHGEPPLPQPIWTVPECWRPEVGVSEEAAGCGRSPQPWSASFLCPEQVFGEGAAMPWRFVATAQADWTDPASVTEHLVDHSRMLLGDRSLGER